MRIVDLSRKRMLGRNRNEPDLPFGSVELIQSITKAVEGTTQYSGATISTDKTILYVSSQGYKVLNFNIVDIDDANTWTVRSLRSISSDTRGLCINNSGTKLYIAGTAGAIRQTVLTTPHDLSVETLGASFDTGLGGLFGGAHLSPDEMTMFASFYFASPTLTKIAEIQLQSPGDLTGAQLIGTVDVPTGQRGCAFSPNGDYFITGLNTVGYIHTVSPAFTLQNLQTQQITGAFNSVGQPAIDHVNNRLYTAIWMQGLRIHKMIF